jgi:hypothetical protein
MPTNPNANITTTDAASICWTAYTHGATLDNQFAIPISAPLARGFGQTVSELLDLSPLRLHLFHHPADQYPAQSCC